MIPTGETAEQSQHATAVAVEGATIQAAVINNTAITSAIQGDLDSALSHFKHAIELQQHAGVSVSLDTAACLINLGNVYNRLGEHSSALEQYRQAILIQERLPYSGPDRAAAYQNIGLIYENDKKYNDALMAYKTALQIRETELGLHDDTLRSLSDVADVYDALGDSVQASSYRNRAVQMTISILQHHTHNTAELNGSNANRNRASNGGSGRDRDLIEEFFEVANTAPTRAVENEGQEQQVEGQ